MKHLIKRGGHRETYDKKKLHKSIYRAGLNSHHTSKQATNIAAATVKKVETWIKKKKTVKAHDLHRQVIKALKDIDGDVALMYEHHDNIC